MTVMLSKVMRDTLKMFGVSSLAKKHTHTVHTTWSLVSLQGTCVVAAQWIRPHATECHVAFAIPETWTGRRQSLKLSEDTFKRLPSDGVGEGGGDRGPQEGS